jgi:hypothetical protein
VARSAAARLPAAADHYAVIRVGDGWRLLFAGGVVGRFRTREAATAVAETVCAASAALGVEVALTVQTHTGELRRELVRRPRA